MGYVLWRRCGISGHLLANLLDTAPRLARMRIQFSCSCVLAKVACGDGSQQDLLADVEISRFAGLAAWLKRLADLCNTSKFKAG